MTACKMMEFLENFHKIIDEQNLTDSKEMQAIFNYTNEFKNSQNSQPFEEIAPNVVRNAILIIAYVVLITISIFGNTLVCYVIFKNRRMRTVTNLFIANLAVADLLLTCINAPFNLARNMFDEWPFGSVMCHLLNFSLMVSVYVSTFTLLGIAIDRQQVLLYPLNPRISRPVGFLVLVLIWLLAIGLSLPFGLYNKVQTVDFVFHNVNRCTLAYPYPSEKWEMYLTICTFLLQYIIPLFIIGVTYGRIVRKLWVRSHVGAVTQNQQVSQQKAKRKSIRMLIFVVVIFALCWMPLNLYQVLADFHPNVVVFHYNSTTFFICHWIAISSTCYNPFVYCWLNETFRNEVKSRFKCCFWGQKRIHPGSEIDGILLRTDRAYRQRDSRSSGSLLRVCISKSAAQYNVDISIPIKGQSEFLTENVECPCTDICTTTSYICGSLDPVPEVPESKTASTNSLPE